MKTIEVITTEQVMEEYKQTRNFVVRNATAMGGRRGRFDRVLVEEFFSNYFREELRIEAEKDERAAALGEKMEKTLKDAIAKYQDVPENVRPIKGKKTAA